MKILVTAVRRSGVDVWDRAQKALGKESISSILTDCLKARLRSGPTLDNVQVIRGLLDEANAEFALGLELHPFWSPVILDANTLDVGYKLHQKGARPDRIMSLIVDPFNFAESGHFSDSVKARIKEAIADFWGSGRTDRHVVVRIGNVDILSRLQNLVGKHGLVLMKAVGDHAREFEFTILAVHPADGLPSKGDDNAFQR